MLPIVLSFHPDGQVEYTRNSKFQPWDGRGKMQRVTDIRKLPDGKLFYIHWMQGLYAGRNHTYGMSIAANVISTCPSTEAVIYFSSYEAAVEHEVEVLNAMRRQGVKFNDAAT